jgi:hypothetical protein
VERVFDVHQSHGGIVQHPARTCSEKMWKVIINCMMLHNIIVEK